MPSLAIVHPERLAFEHDPLNPDVVDLVIDGGDTRVRVRAWRPAWDAAFRGPVRQPPAARDLFEAGLIDVADFERRLEKEMAHA